MQIWRLGSVSSQGCIGAPAILWWWGPGRIDIGGGPRHPRLALLPFPSEINFDEFGCYEHIFIDIPSYLPELFCNFKAFWFTVRLRGKALRPWVGVPNRKSQGQIMRVGRSGVMKLKLQRDLENDDVTWKTTRVIPFARLPMQNGLQY